MISDHILPGDMCTSLNPGGPEEAGPLEATRHVTEVMNAGFHSHGGSPNKSNKWFKKWNIAFFNPLNPWMIWGPYVVVLFAQDVAMIEPGSHPNAWVTWVHGVHVSIMISSYLDFGRPLIHVIIVLE